MNVEVNGPANIIMILESMLENGLVTPEAYEIIRKEAENTLEYMKVLENPNNIRWSDIKVERIS